MSPAAPLLVFFTNNAHYTRYTRYTHYTHYAHYAHYARTIVGEEHQQWRSEEHQQWRSEGGVKAKGKTFLFWAREMSASIRI